MGMFVHDDSEKEFNYGYENEENWFKDVIDGRHEEGLGWNPNGVYCGECSNLTCVGCISRNETK